MGVRYLELLILFLYISSTFTIQDLSFEPGIYAYDDDKYAVDSSDTSKDTIETTKTTTQTLKMTKTLKTTKINHPTPN